MVTGVTVEKIERGKNKDNNKNKPLSLSRIYVTNPDGTKAARTITLDDGVFRFQVPDGKYEVLIENQGHKSYKTTLEVSGQDINLGEITLEIGEEISAAAITDKSLVHRYGTRIRYDVWRDPDRSKINMTEMISRIPSLRLSSKDGRLVYNNEKISKILIDKEDNSLINAARQYPMEFIKAHYMKDVVVVLPGDPEYNNDKPILLVNLAAKLPYGASSEQSVSVTTKNEYSPSLDAVVNTPFIGVGVNYSFSYDKAPTLSSGFSREVLSETSDVSRIESVQSSWNRARSHKIGTSLFRGFSDDLIKFTANIKTSYSDATSFSESVSRTFASNGSTLSDDRTTMHGSSTKPFRFNAAFRLKGAFGKQIGRMNNQRTNRWRVEYSYSDNASERQNDYQTYMHSSSSESKEHRLNTSLLSSFLRGPVKMTGDFNAGFFDRSYNEFSDYSGRAVGFDYNQRVCYSKLSLMGSFLNNKVSYSASLRPEYLENKGYFLNGDTRSPLNYHSFTISPSVSMLYDFKRASCIISYMNSVRRPSVNQLNPYEDRSNPYYIRTGNPDLKGSKTNMYSLNINPRVTSKWLMMPSLGVSYSKTDGMINSITSTDEDGVAVSSFQNCGTSESLGLSGRALQNFGKSIHTSVFVNYNRNRIVLPSGLKNTYNTVSFSADLTWSTKYFDLMSMAWVSPTASSVQSKKLRMEPDLEMSISRYFSKIHLGTSLSVSDALHSGGRRESTIHDVNFTEYNFSERLGRTVSFNVYWRFGRFKNAETVEVSAYDM